MGSLGASDGKRALVLPSGLSFLSFCFPGRCCVALPPFPCQFSPPLGLRENPLEKPPEVRGFPWPPPRKGFPQHTLPLPSFPQSPAPPADRQLGAWIHAILNPFCDVDFHSKLYTRGFLEWRGNQGVAAFFIGTKAMGWAG